MTTSLQGLTAAIAPSAIEYFTRALLAPELTHAVKSLRPPDKSISAPKILLDDGMLGDLWAENIRIGLSSGQLHGFEPAFSGVTQNDAGQFTLVMSAPTFSASFNWSERYNDVSRDINGYITGQRVKTRAFKYTVGFESLTLTVVFKFEYRDHAWDLAFVSATPTLGKVTPNIPGSSIVTRQKAGWGWCSSTIGDATKSAVETIDFSGAVSAIVKPLFSSVPATGRITADIAFQFEEGPDGLTFPANQGIAAGVTGVALYDGKVYSGPNPPQIAVPAVPQKKHLAYNVSGYSLDSLMWAFFAAGSLRQTIGPGNLPDPSVLNTRNYCDGALQALCDAYPDMQMTADVAASAPPTVAFQQIYDLTNDAYAKLKPELPPEVYGKLGRIVGLAFLTEPEFNRTLANDIGKDDADEFETIIDQAARINAAVLTHGEKVVLNVIQDAKPIPVITFEVAQTDVLQEFLLGVSHTAQSLQFGFQMISAKATFVSSSVPGITGGDFGDIWKFALRPVYSATMEAIGKAGVALPRVPGFDLLFDEAVVTVEDGYVGVVTDVTHTSDVGLVHHLASKVEVVA